MDVEARRKFCGLLMFDIPTISMKSPTSRNNDIIINNMSTQEVDPSSLNNNHSLSFESSHNPIDQFIIQDNFTSDFATTTRALAAGAAATSDDLLNQDASNAMDGDNSRSQPQKRTPRPPNAFILYRRAKQPGIIASQRNLTNAEVSRTISDMWRKEPEETRLEWEKYADRKKLEHMQTYPNYVYRPNKNKSKVDKRRQNRRQTTNSSNGSSNNNNSVENKPINSGATPVRRKSTKNANRPLSKLDLPLSMNNNGMAGFNMQPSSIPMNQQQSSTNSTSHSDTMTSNSSYTTILPSPEIPLLSSHFTENPEEFVNSQSQLTPLTPLTPHTPLTPISTPEQIQMREHDFKIRQHQQYQNSLLRFEDLNAFQQQQHHNQHHQGNAQFSFQSMNGLTPYNPTGFSQVDQLEYFVPDVAQQQQQMMAEMLLHHDQHHHITPATTTVPSSNSTSISTIPVQYYSGSNATTAAINGNPSFTEMLNNLEFQTFLSGSVNHAPDQYLQ